MPPMSRLALCDTCACAATSRRDLRVNLPHGTLLTFAPCPFHPRACPMPPCLAQLLQWQDSAPCSSCRRYWPGCRQLKSVRAPDRQLLKRAQPKASRAVQGRSPRCNPSTSTTAAHSRAQRRSPLRGRLGRLVTARAYLMMAMATASRPAMATRIGTRCRQTRRGIGALLGARPYAR